MVYFNRPEHVHISDVLVDDYVTRRWREMFSCCFNLPLPNCIPELREAPQLKVNRTDTN